MDNVKFGPSGNISILLTVTPFSFGVNLKSSILGTQSNKCKRKTNGRFLISYFGYIIIKGLILKYDKKLLDFGYFTAFKNILSFSFFTMFAKFYSLRSFYVNI